MTFLFQMQEKGNCTKEVSARGLIQASQFLFGSTSDWNESINKKNDLMVTSVRDKKSQMSASCKGKQNFDLKHSPKVCLEENTARKTLISTEHKRALW